MKKKLLIFIAVIGLVFVAGYSSIASEAPKEDIKKTWDFKGGQVDSITLDGSQQDLNVVLIDSDADTTTVELSGKVSSTAYKLLEKAEVKDGKLTLPFSKQGFKLVMTSDEKDPLTVKITTNLSKPFKKIDFDLMGGEVKMVVPETYEGRYETDIYQGNGKVLSVPETTKKMNSLISVSTSEDISIIK